MGLLIPLLTNLLIKLFKTTRLTRTCVEYDKEQQDKRDALQAEIDALKDENEVAKKIAEKEAELSTLGVLPVSEEML